MFNFCFIFLFHFKRRLPGIRSISGLHVVGHTMNNSTKKPQNSLFCDRFSSYQFTKTTGTEPFKTAFVINAILNVPFCIVATLANLLVIVSIWRSHSLRTPANLLLVGLALSDLGVGLIEQPVYIASLLFFAKNGPVSSRCVISVAVSIFGSVFSSVSFGTVVAISAERYIALSLHLRYENVVTRKRVRIFLICLWLVCGILPFMWVLLVPKYRSYFFAIGIVLCLLVSSVMYMKIYQIIRYHRRQIQAYEINGRNDENIVQRRRNASNMFLVYCVLILCYLPYSICLGFGKFHGYTKSSWIAVNFTLTVININSSLNPFIYCYRMRGIRQAMLQTLHTATRQATSFLGRTGELRSRTSTISSNDR